MVELTVCCAESIMDDRRLGSKIVELRAESCHHWECCPIFLSNPVITTKVDSSEEFSMTIVSNMLQTNGNDKTTLSLDQKRDHT